MMEFTEAPVLNISLDFGNDAEFEFNNLGAGWPLGSASGSSCASSSFGPHTPTSGRSSPHYSGSFDFGSSFASSTGVVPFDHSPPSSATSTYFPMTPKTSNVSSFVYPVFPTTPSRGQLVFSCDPLSSYAVQLTPSQNMDCSFPVNHLDSHPYMDAPPALGRYDHLSMGASHWAYPDSPISFDQQHSPVGVAQPVQSIKQEFDEDTKTPMTPMTPSITAKKRVLMDQTRHKTMALQQQMQQFSPSRTRTRAKRGKKCGTAAVGDDNFSMGAVEPATKCECPVEGCDKQYRRSEHMKRHIQRMDNLTTHIKLHWAPREHPGSKPRVKYCPAAKLQWEKMVQNQRRGGGGARRKARAGSAK
ncbi:hypothetical protein CHGG_08234 [Chaetomium globosum CBS 148.51]|uniref:C2H2-type domain-containing protein n=1 Tax=Chaetomium globosum (strain ATCC 6205 / CBS 148.51 / DSM 1962 / NBRC 6347 / NRRL 1970) TaxID=306901 RepID=Q2GUX0_CHAGB|nr:uncharacterized protein CHGG_08234 [Chaetomium globosum CBS 148.51]EAQ86981.1 hypothetical protein CHGG_08234 [Chaetomium globosum CBS 148.51]